GSGFFSAVIAGFYNLRAAQSQYENDCYKTVINRRIVAYEKLELLIVWFKASVLDKDDKPYHILFSYQAEEGWKRIYGLVHDVMSQGLWLSDEVFTKARELSDLMFH